MKKINKNQDVKKINGYEEYLSIYFPEQQKNKSIANEAPFKFGVDAAENALKSAVKMQ